MSEPTPDTAAERARAREDGSIHVTLSNLPGFHFILAPREGIGDLLSALDQFVALYLRATEAGARRAALLSVYRELAYLSEHPIGEDLVALVNNKRVSRHDALQLGWASAFNSVQAILKRNLASSPAAASPPASEGTT